jgi:glycosidase
MQKRLTLIFGLIFLSSLAACASEDQDLLTKAAPAFEGATVSALDDTAEGAATQPTNTPIPPAPTEPPAPTISPTRESSMIPESNASPWWNDAVFYEVFVRSFQDSDGDGVGDINGLIERLDYLNDGNPDTTGDLGVTGIWLMPIMESPSYHGYDVVDYFKIDEEYGTEEDFRRLIEEAHARGIKVIVDLVMNHTGRDHSWFQEALDPESDQRDWYVWSEESPGYRGPWGQPVWHEAEDDYYYGVFWDGMPDLNYENPEVTEEMYEAARFWLEDMGVDGFRLDAIKHLIEDGALQENTPATHEWLQGFFAFYKDVNPDAFAVGEAWTSTQQVLDYTGDEVDIAFQFDLAKAAVNSSSVGLGSLFAKEMEAVVDSYPPGQFATFLTNHDQNRVMSQLKEDENAAKVASSLLLTSPGVPFIYYGEEIGMMGEKPDEDIRRPMQWTADGPGAGFTDGRPWRPPFEDFQERNVAAQNMDPDSLLNHYRSLIRLRGEHSALRGGDWTLVDTDPGRLYAALRHDDDETLLVLINPSDREVTDYGLSLPAGPIGKQAEAKLIFGEGSPQPPSVNAAGGFDDYRPLASSPPQSTFVFVLSTP